tara:strand:+ start:243 stop:611 length:369 start_codon:yes stop_codon:yes gene_type:complete
MKVNIVSKPNQKLKYLDPDFDTEGVDEDDYEYIYCEDFFATSDAEDYIASNIFDYDYDKGVVKFEFNGTDDELMEYGADYDGSPELWEVYDRIEKFAEDFDIDWEICEFIDDSGTQWGESVV